MAWVLFKHFNTLSWCSSYFSLNLARNIMINTWLTGLPVVKEKIKSELH